jgi:hypothetical protein
MDALERAVVAPQIKVIEQRRARRQVFRDRPPLASRAEDVHDPVHHLADVDRAFVAAGLGRRDQRRNLRPLLVREVTRVAQLAAVVTLAVLRRPHR